MAMKIPTLSNGFLYHVNKHRQHWLTKAERQRVAFIVIAALVTVITAGVIAWIVRPL